MDDIGDILRGRMPVEPPEIKIVRQFVEARFSITPSVSLKGRQCVIGVPNGALAGALRPRLMELYRELQQPELRLVIRIEHGL